MYQALYRKYRPTNFSEIAGQTVIVQTLKNAIINDRLSHAYLFTGPRGTGKTSIAKIVAKTINCECLNDFIPCDECKSCLEFNSKNDVDIIEIDAASNNGVDEIREIRNKIDLVPSFSKYKVYIIDEVHMLTTGAFNALLKTLEEPPKHIIFILATTEPHKIPATILSRCQRFDFKRIAMNEIVTRLSYICENENIAVSNDVLFEIAKLSDGGLRDSISLLDQVIAYSNKDISINSVHEVNGSLNLYEIKDFFDSLLNLNYNELFKKIDFYVSGGKNLVKITEGIIDFTKNLLLSYEAPEYLREKIVDLSLFDGYSVSSKILIDIIEVFNKGLNNMKISSNMELVLEMTLLEISNIVKPEPIENKSFNVSIETQNNYVYEKRKKNNDFEMLKKIRVDNTLSRFNKSLLREMMEKIDNIKNYLLDDHYGKWASMLLDGKMKAASDEYVIFVFDNLDLSNMFNENIEIIEDLFEKVVLIKYKLISVSLSEWNVIRNDFNSKSRKFIYKKEILDSKSNNDADEIASLFGNVVEYS